MITEWWSTLTPATQIQYWGYICFVGGALTIEICNRLIATIRKKYGTN